MDNIIKFSDAQMSSHKLTREGIEKLIEHVKEDYEEELARKKALYLKMEDESIFTEEDKDYMYQSIEEFYGSVPDMVATKKFKVLVSLAKKLDADSMDVKGIQTDGVMHDSKNAYVSVDVRRITMMNGENVQTMAKMMALSDVFWCSAAFIINGKDFVRLTFGVNGVWKC